MSDYTNIPAPVVATIAITALNTGIIIAWLMHIGKRLELTKNEVSKILLGVKSIVGKEILDRSAAPQSVLDPEYRHPRRKK